MCHSQWWSYFGWYHGRLDRGLGCNLGPSGYAWMGRGVASRAPLPARLGVYVLIRRSGMSRAASRINKGGCLCAPASPGLRSKAGTYLFHLSRYLLSVPGFLRAGLPYKWKRLPQFLPLVLTLSSSHNALNPKIRTFTPSWLLSATSRLPDLSVLTTTVSGPWSFFDG